MTTIAHSSATRQPQLRTPPGACDAHLHIYDAALDVRTPEVLRNATVAQYERLQALLGTQRSVVVQPRPYGTDHRVTLDAIARLGIANTRGIGVVHPGVSDAELQTLHQGGIRGVRFSLYTPHQAVVDFDMVEPLGHRLHELGWHLQLHWTAEQIVTHADLLLRLPTTLVFDHLARLPVPAGATHPAFALVRELIATERAWVKLSGAYLCSQQATGSGHPDVTDMARAWASLAPDRLVWGSDWPHTTEPDHKPDDTELLDLLLTWTGSEALYRQVLVDNPAQLYGFES